MKIGGNFNSRHSRPVPIGDRGKKAIFSLLLSLIGTFFHIICFNAHINNIDLHAVRQVRISKKENVPVMEIWTSRQWNVGSSGAGTDFWVFS